MRLFFHIGLIMLSLVWTLKPGQLFPGASSVGAGNVDQQLSSCDGKKCTDDCCRSEKHSHGASGCPSGCDGIMCQTVYPAFCDAFFNSENIQATTPAIGAGRPQFYYTLPIYSFAFQHIWQPPKIG